MSAEELIEQVKSLRRDERFDEAINVALKATQREPRNAETWWELGLSQHRRSGLADAKHAFEKTVELAPAFGYGRWMLGLSQLDVGDKDAARINFRAAYEHDSTLECALEKLLPLYEETNDEEDGRPV